MCPRRRRTVGQPGSAPTRRRRRTEAPRAIGPAVRGLVTGTSCSSSLTAGRPRAASASPPYRPATRRNVTSRQQHLRLPPRRPRPGTPTAAVPSRCPAPAASRASTNLCLQVDGRREVNSRGHNSSCRRKPRSSRTSAGRGRGSVGPPDPLAYGTLKHSDEWPCWSGATPCRGPARLDDPWPGRAPAAAERPGRRHLGREPCTRSCAPGLSLPRRTAAIHDSSADPRNGGGGGEGRRRRRRGCGVSLVSDVSSTTKLVCSEESSFIRNLTVTVLPL